jgi:hypothetical protein
LIAEVVMLPSVVELELLLPLLVHTSAVLSHVRMMMDPQLLILWILL